LQIEKQNGIACCDGDPLHLYFSWALWKAGSLSRNLFDVELPLYGRAIEEGRIGFADLVLWHEAPLEELRRRAKSDSTRRRRRHELYLSMIPWMKTWFAAREWVLHGTVRELSHQFHIEDLRALPLWSCRYDSTVLDAMVSIVTERAEQAPRRPFAAGR
jgi:hypothetical protein